MNLFGMMDVSGSALTAERVRAEVVASNMANAETTRTADGSGPYKRQHVVFSAEGAQGGSFGSTLRSQMGAAADLSAGSGFTTNFGSAFSSNAGAGGVQIAGVVEDQGAPQRRFDPGHPDADAEGYVSFPDINPLTEMVDLMGATRAYGMNASAVQAEKGMVSASLDLLK